MSPSSVTLSVNVRGLAFSEGEGKTVYKNDCLKDHLKRSLFIRGMAQVGKQKELIFCMCITLSWESFTSNMGI